MGWDEVGAEPKPTRRPKGAWFWILVFVVLAAVALGIRYAVTGSVEDRSSRDEIIDALNDDLRPKGVEVEVDGDRLVVVRGTCNLFTLVGIAGDDTARETLKKLGFSLIACNDGTQLPLR